jgi:rare lipoprotein A
LRAQFGGVRHGRLYRPAYVLVESGDKQAIVRINDVGPLKPGRVIDLNERAMRYFDPFLRRGLLPDVRVTLLPGEDWTPGPVGTVPLTSYASAQ